MLHTTFVQVRAPLWPNVFQNRHESTRRNVCGLAVPGMPRDVLAFFHLRQPASLLHLGKSVVKVKALGREIRIGRILICVRVIIVLVVGINPVTVEW